MASNAGDVSTTVVITLVPLSDEHVRILECPCNWCKWRAAVLLEILELLYDVDAEVVTPTVD
jgi:hypothetical protein